MTMADQDGRLVNSLATSLFENLVVYTQKQEGRVGGSGEAVVVCEFDKNDDAQIQKWLSEMMPQVQRLRRGNNNSNEENNDEEIVRKAMLQAIRRYKNKDPSSYPNNDDDSCNNYKKKKKQNVMSFSIFDQLNSGSLLDSMITWDRIEAAGAESSSSSKEEMIPTSEQLKLLQKIEHLDDIMIDWENVNDLLLRGLLLLLTAAGNGTTTDTRNCSGGEYLDLHNKWFEKTRNSTSDHQFIQIDLCQNIVSVLLKMQQQQKQLNQKEEEEEDWTYRLCKSFRSMWMDWMLRGLFIDDDNERVNAIGITLWGWVTRPEVIVVNNTAAKSSSSTSSSAPPAFYPSQIGLAMMRIDPYARCLSAWFAHLKPDQILQNLILLVSTGSSPLPLLISYCKDAMLGEDDGDQLDNNNNNCSSSSSKSDTTAICCRYVLATIASILDVVRISRFPFDDIILQSSPDDNNIASTREQVIIVLFILYIRLLIDSSLTLPSSTNADGNNNNNNHNSVQDPIFVSIAANAIETLLWGCQRGSEDNIKVFRVLKTKLEALELNTSYPSVKIILDRFR